MESKIGPFVEGTSTRVGGAIYKILDTDIPFFTSEAGYTIKLREDNNLVLEDTIAPTFTNDPRVETVTDSKATINFSSNEEAKVYWLIDPVTQPDASDIMTKGNSQDTTGEETSRITLNDLEASKKHEVYMLLEDTSGNISDIEVLQFMTNQAAPTLTLKDLKVNYKTETFELLTEFEAYTNLDDPSGSMLTPEGTILSAIPGQTIYVRYKEKEVETSTIPASAPVAITFPKRPIAPAKKELTVTVDSIKVNNLVSGEEYLLVKKGDLQNWDQANQTGQFTGLEMNTEYTLYARKAYVEGSAFVSLASNVDIKTLSMNEVVSMVEGTNQIIYYGDDAVFKSSAAFEDFIQVVIDDQILDKDKYTKQNGSTIITLKAEYLKTLSMGEHTISIQSTSGNAIAQFKMAVKEIPGINPDQPNTTPEQPNTNLDQPNTGDTTNIVLMSLLVLLSFITIVFLWKKKPQKEQE